MDSISKILFPEDLHRKINCCHSVFPFLSKPAQGDEVEGNCKKIYGANKIHADCSIEKPTSL